MKYNIYEWEELTDSKELYISKPRPISIIFIYILLTILATVLVFSYVGQKEVVIKAQGIVRPSTGITTIKSEVTAKINSVNFTEGSFVEKGTTLLILEHEDLVSEKQFIESELALLKEELRLNSLLVKSINEDKNLFDSNEGEDFQNQYELYQTKKKMLLNEIDILKNQYSESLSNKNTKIDNLSDEESRLKNKLLRIQSLISAIKNSTSFPLNNDVYDTKYQSYVQLREQLTKQINQLNSNMEENKEKIESLNGELEKLKQENIILLESEEDSLKEAIIGIQNSIQEISNTKTENNIENEINRAELSIDELKKELINQLSLTKEEIDSKIKAKEKEIELLDLQIEKYKIEAPVSGQIVVKNSLSSGEYLQSGAEIIEIVPIENDSKNSKIVEILVDSNKSLGLKVGQEVRYNFYNLPNNKSGSLEGNITHINPDATFTQNGDKFHLIKATIEDEPVYNYKGEQLHLTNGMSAEVSIITDKKRIIYYLLEKLNFIN